MSHPDGLPDLFLDQSLGRAQVPRLLREAGLRLTTPAERFGTPADEGVSDVTWLEDAGHRREAVLITDAPVRYNAAERQTLLRFKVGRFASVSRSHSSSCHHALQYLRR